MAGILNKIHSTPPDKSTSYATRTIAFIVDLAMLVPVIVDAVRPILHSCQQNTAALASLIPANQFWRWKDNWANPLRNAIFSAALLEFLTSGHLVTLAHVGEILGSKLSSAHPRCSDVYPAQSTMNGTIDLRSPPKTICMG